MKNIEHIPGKEDITQMVHSPAGLEGKSCAQIEELFAQNGYTHIDAEDAARRNADIPQSAFVRTADGKIIHVGLQGSKQYWLNVIVEDVAHPTDMEKRMIKLYTNMYRDIGNVKEGTEFTEFAAQNLTGPIREERAGIVKKMRGIFSSAA